MSECIDAIDVITLHALPLHSSGSTSQSIQLSSKRSPISEPFLPPATTLPRRYGSSSAIARQEAEAGFCSERLCLSLRPMHMVVEPEALFIT